MKFKMKAALKKINKYYIKCHPVLNSYSYSTGFKDNLITCPEFQNGMAEDLSSVHGFMGCESNSIIWSTLSPLSSENHKWSKVQIIHEAIIQT